MQGSLDSLSIIACLGDTIIQRKVKLDEETFVHACKEVWTHCLSLGTTPSISGEKVDSASSLVWLTLLTKKSEVGRE